MNRVDESLEECRRQSSPCSAQVGAWAQSTQKLPILARMTQPADSGENAIEASEDLWREKSLRFSINFSGANLDKNVMPEITVSFATGPDGSDILVPDGTEWIRIMGWTPGKPGAPSMIFLEDDPEPFRVAPDAPPSALNRLPSGNYRGVFLTRTGKRISRSFPFAVKHLGGEPGGEPGANNGVGSDPYTQRYIERLEAAVDKFTGQIDKLADKLVALANKAMDTQVEVVKVMPKSVEASSKLVGAANGDGRIAENVSELFDVMERVPSADSNLETVLNSPVVVGAAAALQKYMAKAAENGAEAVAAKQSGRRESMAERAARISAAADDRAGRQVMARSRA